MSHLDFYYHFHLPKARYHHPCTTDETNNKDALVAFWGLKIIVLEVLIFFAMKKRTKHI